MMSLKVNCDESLEHFAIMTRSKQRSMKNYETSEWSQNNGIGRQKK